MLPPALPLVDVDGLLDGLLEIAARTRVTLAGGNITRSPGPLVVDVTVVGSVRPRRILKRSGGRPGDSLYVSGSIGAAAAGLGWLRQYGERGLEVPDDPDLAACVARHRRPEPRARLGALLGRTRAASACMDLSDGWRTPFGRSARRAASAPDRRRRIADSPGAVRWFWAGGEDAVRPAFGWRRL
jgi:thiamine-monophosphate kinase